MTEGNLLKKLSTTAYLQERRRQKEKKYYRFIEAGKQGGDFGI